MFHTHIHFNAAFDSVVSYFWLHLRHKFPENSQNVSLRYDNCLFGSFISAISYMRNSPIASIRNSPTWCNQISHIFTDVLICTDTDIQNDKKCFWMQTWLLSPLVVRAKIWFFSIHFTLHWMYERIDWLLFRRGHSKVELICVLHQFVQTDIRRQIFANKIAKRHQSA